MPVIRPQEQIARLRARHAPALTWREKQVIAATELGYTTAETAELIDREEPTVRHHLGEAQHKIFDLAEVTPSRALLSRWCREHYSCCMGPCLELIETDQLFAS